MLESWLYKKNMAVQLKPKLPRKRKKDCIKHTGRIQYKNTIELAKITGESPCKFWKTIVDKPHFFDGNPLLLPTPTSYW